MAVLCRAFWQIARLHKLCDLPKEHFTLESLKNADQIVANIQKAEVLFLFVAAVLRYDHLVVPAQCIGNLDAILYEYRSYDKPLKASQTLLAPDVYCNESQVANEAKKKDDAEDLVNCAHVVHILVEINP